MTGVRKCIHCGELPEWTKFIKGSPESFLNEGKLEHWCNIDDGEFYEFGRFQRLLNEWCKQNDPR
jgi:hypothetical protein